MSFKAIKEFLNQFNPLSFGDIGKVILELEKDHQLKCNAVSNFYSGKINEAEFKRQFYWLIDVKDKITFLKHTFSHDNAVLEIIEKLEKNIEEQTKQIIVKKINYTNLEALKSKLKEEGEIFAIETQLAKKTKQEEIEPQQTNATFENINLEPVASKEQVTFDQSLINLRKRGYQRHPRPQEEFALLISYLEGRLSPQQNKIAEDMLKKRDWLSCALERQGNVLIVYLDPEGFIFDGEKYVKGKNFKFLEVKRFTINSLPSQQLLQLNKIQQELTQYIYGRTLKNLPEKIQKDAYFYLPVDNTIWPVARGYFGYDYVVCAYDYFGRASRGVVVGKKIGR